MSRTIDELVDILSRSYTSEELVDILDISPESICHEFEGQIGDMSDYLNGVINEDIGGEDEDY